MERPLAAPSVFAHRPRFCRYIILAALAFTSGAVQAQEVWDAGSGVDFSWSNALNWTSDTEPLAGTDVLFPLGVPNPGVLANPFLITLGAGEVANSLAFSDDYMLTGGDLALTTGVVHVNLAELAILDTQLTGTAGLTKQGGGMLVLSNAANNYTGATTITNGALVIRDQGALGTDTSAVVVTGSSSRGFGGGTLVLDAGPAGTMNFTRDLSLQGLGPIADRNAAFISRGNVTLSGAISGAVAPTTTRIIATYGNLTLAGGLNAAGTAGTHITSLGGVNQAGGGGNFHLTGPLTGTGTLEKAGGGTLFLNPSDTTGFSGVLRVSGSVASGQSSVRITSPNVLGSRTNSTTGAVLDMNGGVLEVRMDNPLVTATGGTNANVYGRASSTLVVDHAPGSMVLNGAVTYGNLSYEDNITLTFNGRNGYSMSFTTAPVNGGNANSTMTNNLQGNGLLSFNGNFWSNADNGANRTMTIGGNGHTLINGSIIASSAAFNHNITKTGSGTLTVTGTASTLDGNVNVNGGTFAITDFRSINNNTANINIGTSGTTGTLSIGTSVAATAAGLITDKVINLAGTTGGAIINANQDGLNPVIFNSNFTATGGSATQNKLLTLGGTNTADNTVAGSISNNNNGGMVTIVKSGSGTWVLSGANSTTGSTQINNGTLKLRDSIGGTNIQADTTGIGFFGAAAAIGTAGGTLEYVGADGSASSETLGPLVLVQGSGTVRVTPGAGGTADLILASIGATQTTAAASSASTTITLGSTAGLAPGMRLNGGSAAATISSITNGTQIVVSAAQTIAAGTELTFDRPNGGATVNFDPGAGANVIIGSVPAAGLLNAYSYFQGADFAYAPSTSNATLRAPIYDTDAGFVTAAGALSDGNNNLVTQDVSTGAATITSLKIDGAISPIVDQTGLLTIRTGAAGTSGGILVTNGSATIEGTGITTGGAADMIIRVDGAADSLMLNAPLTSTTTGGLTKTGAGTLVIAGVNAQTGTTNLLEGTIQLETGGRLSANSVALTMRQGTVFDLNGVTTAQSVNTTSISAFNGSGTITNTSANAVLFAVGGGTSGGTGTFNGTINEVAGQISVVKMGTSNAQTWTGISNYTGSTTIGVAGTGTSGTLSVTNLANIGSDSSIGRGDATSLATNQASLVFGGTTGGLIYTGADSVSTDRLFTLAGTTSTAGATITNNGVNAATLVFSNTGPIAFSSGVAQRLRLGGSSSGDNYFNPQIIDNGANATTLEKIDAGVWFLGNSANSYTGDTVISLGMLGGTSGTTIPTASNIVFNGGVLLTSGNLNRTLGTGADEFRFAAPAANTARLRGGYAADTTKLTVDWGSTPTWGVTANFLDTRDGLLMGSTVALSDVEIVNDFSLGTADGQAKTLTVTTASGSSTVTLTGGTNTSGLIVGQSISGTNIPSGAYILSINSATQISISASASASGSGISAEVAGNAMRTIRVDDNGNTGADFVTLSGDISGDAGTGIRKVGSGILHLLGDNTYTGETNVNQGTLVVTSLGNSAVASASSVGSSVGGNSDGGAVTLGNGGTGAGILQYVGEGEISDRKIRLNSTTGSNQIHADGIGPLVLTNVANDMAEGAKTLFLRGTNAGGNMITSALDDNSGVLNITVDGAASWILSSDISNYSGVTSVNAGALGIGHDFALGASQLSLSSGTMFAHGGDRSISNGVDQDNNTTTAFIGDYSLAFTSTLVFTGTNSNFGTVNNIASGKSLTFSGLTADSITGNRTWTVNGGGHTIVDGNITTANVGGFGFNITKTGTGTLTLRGTSSDWNNGNVTVNNGTFQLGADNVIPDEVDSGNVIINPALGNTATFDVNGHTETINGLTANSAGSIVIDNTAATAGSLTFGDNDAAVDLFSGLGSYTITDSGAGALSIFKAGNTSATIAQGATLTYQGTTGVTGGTFTIASVLDGTTGLSVLNSGSTLALTGGLANASLISSVVVENGGMLSLLDGAGNKLDSLTSLQLGSLHGTMTSLRLNAGDAVLAGDELATDTLSLLAGGALNLFTGNQVTINVTDIGLNANETYTLISSASGGLTTGQLTAADWLLGATPGGFDSVVLLATDNAIQITTGNLLTGDWYWNAGGALDNWGDVANWSTTKDGLTAQVSTPGQASDVIFVADNIAGGAAITTTLEQNFRVNSLTFEASTNPANTPVSVTIDSDPAGANRLDIAPQSATDGISVLTGGPATVTINAALRVGADQTWTVADATSSLVLAGGLQGEADITKAGAGTVTLTGAADPAFNAGQTVDVTVAAGNLEITNLGALGSTANANLANILLTGGGFFYDGTAANIANNITLAGGTLSGGGGNHTYSSPIINITANSNVNMRDSNSAVLTATARSITLPGQLIGSGRLTVDSINTVVEGNQETGTLTLSGDNSGWSGGLHMVRGTVTATNANALGTGDISASGGRVIFNAAAGSTFNVNNITVDGITIAGNDLPGVLEITADATGTLVSDMTVNINGVITLGSATYANNGLRITQSTDNFSIFNIANSVVLANHGSISVSGATTRPVTISGIISETGGARNLTVNAGGWTTQTVLRLTGANTYTGNTTVNGGVLEFDTVTNAGGAASSLGQGNTITMGAATLRFIGDGVAGSQATDRAITQTGAAIYSANGTNGATITYNGAIDAAGNAFTLTGLAGSEGFITGGITQSGTTADGTANSGTWTLSGAISTIADDFTATGPNAVLNLNGANIISWGASTSHVFNVNNGATVNIGANDAIASAGFHNLFVAQSAGGAPSTLNLNSFNLTTDRLIVGERAADRIGQIIGSGTVTTTGTSGIDLYQGFVSANLGSTGTATIEKFGPGVMILSGDNSALASTGGTIVNEGTLVLDYTASNATKVREASSLSMVGGNLVIQGNASANTVQNVASFTLGSGGASSITMNPGAGQDALLSLGAITRANGSQDGTIRFVLSAGAQTATNGITTTTGLTNGLLGSSGFATVDDGTGVWFATKSGDNIVALASNVSNDVSAWALADHVTDSGAGYTGAIAGTSINSLRFDAAGGSAVNVGSTGALGIASGGILVTDNVASGTPGIFGGTLASGVTELILTHDSAQTFEISSNIRINHAVTKSGTGTLLLSGNNVYTDETEIQNGTLQVTGGRAIGDTSLVTLGINRDSTLELLADETIGRLQGGKRGSNSDYGTVAIGEHTLTINQSANTSYAGFFTGTGNLVMNTGGVGNLNVSNNSSGFTGSVVVSGGLLQLSGIGQINASSFTINRGGNLLLDKNSSTRLATQVLDTAAIILNSADGGFSGASITLPRGLGIRSDQTSTNTEVVGVVTANSGANYVTLEATAASVDPDLRMNNLLRSNNATLNVRGTVLGLATANVQRTQFEISDATNQTAFIATLVGGAGAADTHSVSIVPWAIGESFASGLANTNMGNSLVTYETGSGFRPLNFATEYDVLATAGATDNVRESLTADLTGAAAGTINALVVHNNNTTESDVRLTGTAATLNITSGAMLFTLNTGAVASSEHTIALDGYTDIAVGGTNEYVIHVINPSAAANTATLITTIESNLSSAADITKSGRGTLVLTGGNTAGGGANKTTLNEGVLQISTLDNIGGDSGDLVFAGGTLRLDNWVGDDLSDRNIVFMAGGGTIDTNGNSIALAGSLGSGEGGIAKVGAGTLTLNAAASYTGATTLNNGTLVIAADNATGNGGNLSLAAGTTLDLGTNNITAGLVTTAGASPQIAGTGSITASTGFFFNHTGTTTIGAVLAGAGGVLKGQTNTLTLSGANTFTGTLEVQSGTLSFNSVSMVGGGASALGNPGNATDGVIHMGLTTTATTLQYTGSGHASDRVVGMQGTTGGVTLDADGSGALGLGGVIGEAFGAKTLTLRGSSAAGLQNTLGAILDGAGTIAVTKADANTWVLTGAGTYSGATSVSAGVLQIQHGQALGSTTGGTTITSGAALELAGGINVGAEALSLAGAGISDGGALRNVSGDNTYGGTITQTAAARINSDAGTLALDVASGNAIAGGQALTLGGAGDGVISDAIAIGALTKDGGGTWTINGDAVAGATTISAGTFTVNGNYDSTGGFVVDAGATLTGAGAILDDVTLGSGSVASPGNSPGPMTINGNFTWNGSTLPQTTTQLFEINDVAGTAGVNWDYWNVLGSLTINGSATSTISIDIDSLTLADAPGDAGFDALSSYTWLWASAANGVTLNGGTLSEIFTFDTAGLVGFNPSLGNFSVLLENGVGAAQSLSIQYTAVPEPGSMLLCGLAAAGMAAYGWRRRKQRSAVAAAGAAEGQAELTIAV